MRSFKTLHAAPLAAIALVNSAVPAVPPRSAGRAVSSVRTASTAFTIRPAASASPRSFNISTAGRISDSIGMPRA